MIKSIKRSVIWPGREMAVNALFHPRVTTCNFGDEQFLLMTCQELLGSDCFGPALFSTSSNDGDTWSTPRPIPDMGWRDAGNSLFRGICDVVPEFHPRTRTILAIGHEVYSRNGKFFNHRKAGLSLHSVFCIMDASGRWSDVKPILDIPELNSMHDWVCGNCQRATLSDGDIIIPFYCHSKDQADCIVCSVKFSYDGKNLTAVKKGNQLALPVKRGLLEPSIIQYGSNFYMTIRAEDGCGYFAISDDGLQWGEIIPWRWDDGKAIEMSTTQQHWFRLNGKLYLAYTRKAEINQDIFRWRAPLFAARFDEEKLCLEKDTERIVFPIIRETLADNIEKAALMGNFHCTEISTSKVIITVGESRSSGHWHGDVLMAVIL
jgi:hypothetical protein